MRFAVGGEAYAVSCDVPSLREQVARWATLLAGAGSGPTKVVLQAIGKGAPSISVPGSFEDRLASPDDLFPALEGLVYARLARREPRLAVLHGAAMARRGRAVVFLGPSGAGKSVLALTLCGRGWTYLSDEIAPIDASTRVTAVPRPVALDADATPPALLERLCGGRTIWTTEIATRLGGRRRIVHALPQRAAPSGATFEVAAVVRLEPRSGAAPRLHKLPGTEARALLFAALASSVASPATPRD